MLAQSIERTNPTVLPWIPMHSCQQANAGFEGTFAKIIRVGNLWLSPPATIVASSLVDAEQGPQLTHPEERLTLPWVRSSSQNKGCCLCESTAGRLLTRPGPLHLHTSPTFGFLRTWQNSSVMGPHRDKQEHWRSHTVDRDAGAGDSIEGITLEAVT